MTKFFGYLLLGICALVLAIFILLKIVTVMISALWYLAVFGFLAAGFYFMLKAAKKSDERMGR